MFDKSVCCSYVSRFYMILGKFPASVFPIVGSVTAVIAIVVCYYIAVKKGHEQRWPHTYISNTAKHYPEFIYFRIGTITGSVMNMLAYLVNYFWQVEICGQAVFNLHKYFPKVPLITGIAGTLALFLSTATIDTGIMNNDLHIQCAGLFFIFTVITCFLNTIVSWFIYSKTKKISTFSMATKVILCILLTYQVYLQIFVASGFFATVKSDLGHILQYTLSFTICAYMLLFAYDFKDFTMGYRLIKN